jgi:sarcosine oxidase, subunit beta
MQRAIVVGGGIIGASTALGLSGRGWQVSLYDHGRLGAKSTSRAAGVVSELTWSEDDRPWVRESRERYRRPPGGGESLVRESGSLAWARGEEGERLRAHGQRLAAAGVRVEAPSRDALLSRYPALRLEADGSALLLPEDGVTDAAAYARAAGRAIAHAGGEVHEECAVALAPLDANQIGVRLPDGSVRRADAVVVAAGAWTAAILRGIGLWAPLRPYRTHLSVVAHPRAGDLPRTVFHDVALDWYWVPEAPGRILAGDGTELVEADPETFRQSPDAWFLEDIASHLAARTVDGDQAEIGRAYAGILTATPDRRPFLGRVPGRSDLWIAAGMNGFGVMRGPAIGEAMARRIDEDRETAVPADCRPERCPWAGPPTFPIRPGYTL